MGFPWFDKVFNVATGGVYGDICDALGHVIEDGCANFGDQQELCQDAAEWYISNQTAGLVDIDFVAENFVPEFRTNQDGSGEQATAYLWPSCTFRGQVTCMGYPLQNAKVVFTGMNGLTITKYTNYNGDYSFVGVPKGGATVKFYMDSYDCWACGGYCGMSPGGYVTQCISLPNAINTWDMDYMYDYYNISIGQTRSLYGTAKCKGLAHAYAGIKFYSYKDGKVYTTVTGKTSSTGYFCIYVPYNATGLLVIDTKASRCLSTACHDDCGLSPKASHRQEITVGTVNKNQGTVEICGPCNVSGEVTCCSSPLYNATVHLMVDGHRYATTTNGYGVYSFSNVRAGSGTLRVFYDASDCGYCGYCGMDEDDYVDYYLTLTGTHSADIELL